MADLPPYPGTPRWVKMFGIIGIVVVLVLVIMIFGSHGPGRHTSPGGPTPLIEQGGQSP
jgi:hypothetical protein